MEATTVNAIIAIILVFVVLRYIVFSGSEDANHNPDAPVAHRPSEFRELTNLEQHAAALQAERITRQVDEKKRRPVTDSMIEVVQAIAPDLSVAQIRYDLEITGNIEATVDKYLSEGTLPQPPKFSPEPIKPSNSNMMEWKDTKEERQAQLQRQRNAMLEDARKKFLESNN